jgi:protease II
MKKQIRKIALGFSILVMSCNKESDYSVAVQIKNISTEDLTKIELFAINSQKEEKLLIDKSSLKKGQEISSVFSENMLFASDGSYIFRITSPTKTRQTKFGYFTNGKSLDSGIIINIEPDTIKVDIKKRDL